MSTAPAATRRFGKCTFKGCKTRVVVADITKVRRHIQGEVFCVEHKCSIALTEVKATVVDTMDCGPQCHNAKTDKCKCSCGGAEHGRFA